MPKFVQILKSKTMWVGALTFVAGAVQYVQPVIPPQYVPVALAVAGVATVGLRALTTTPLSEK
jgi:hypothetical protein